MKSLEDKEKSAGIQLARLLHGRMQAILESARMDKLAKRLQPEDLQSINSMYYVLVYQNGSRINFNLKHKLMNDLYEMIGAVAGSLYDNIYLTDLSSKYFSGILNELKESYKLL